MKLSKIFGRQRFFLHLNVQVAVNVHTKFCVTQESVKAPTAGSKSTTKPAPAPSSASALKMLAISPARTSRTKVPLEKNSNSPFGGISLMLVMNLLMLLLLSLCCGVCRSNELTLATTTQAAVEPNATSSPTLTDLLYPAQAAADGAKTVADLLTAVVVMIPEIPAQAVDNITSSCHRACKREESLYANGWGHNCSSAPQADRQQQSSGGVNGRCYRTSCHKGCEQWWHAVKAYETCQEACTWQHSYPYDLPCLAACEASRRTYWHSQLQAMEPIVRTMPPQLYADHNTAMSPSVLQWSVKLPELYLASNQVRIQYQQVQQDGHKEWLYLNKYECSESFDCEIYHDGLLPFTSYSFRFELPFGTGANELLHSQPTTVFKTPASGAPTSAPVITNILSMDQSHVAIFWQPGLYANGPLKSYKLKMKNMATSQSTEKLLPSYVEKYIFDNLSPSTKYSISISMLNEVDIGPSAVAELTTPAMPKSVDSTDDSSILIIAGENSISTKALEPMADTKLVHKSEQLITDYGFYQAEQKLFVVNALGEVNCVLLDQPMKITPLALNKPQIKLKPVKISVDWLNQQIYLGGEIANISWSIATTDLSGNFIDIITNNTTEAIQQLEVDPINGWLFWLTTSGRVERMDLATRHIRTLYAKSGELGYFMNVYGSLLLTAYNKSEHALYELSYDRSYVRGLQQNATQLLGGEWQSYAQHGKYFVATNGTHLLQQHSETKEHELMMVPEIDWCWKLVVGQQPAPEPRSGPHGLQAVLTANKASVSWSAPERAVDFQSAGAWHSWEYQLEIMDVVSNNAFSIRNIRSAYFMVGNLQANNLYKWRVCAMTGRGECVWGEEELLTRTWPLGEHKLIWAGTEGLFETNEMGGNVRRIGGEQLGDVKDFEQLNGTLFYIKRVENSTRQSLTCAFMMNPAVVCGFKAENALSLSYDWRGGKLYWADGLVGCIMRANLDGSQRELLPLFGAQLIEVDAYAGYIYYATAERLLRSTLSGFNELLTVEYFNQYGDEELIRDFALGEIRGFALNLMQQQIYWIYRHPEGKVYLHMSMLDKPGVILEKMPIVADILHGSLKYLNEIQCLMWLSLESHELVLLRTQDFQQQGRFAANVTGVINSVQLGVDYTPFMELSVVPTAVEAESIVIDNGYWDDFNIRWNASLTAANYTVYYRVSFWLSKDNNHSLYSDMLEVNQPFLRINEFRRPHLYLNISITPCTYWAQGRAVNVRLHTPGVERSQPRHLRAFVEHTALPLQAVENISAVVRWDQPENYSIAAPKAYRINCWLDKQLLGIYNHSGVEPLELRLANLTAGASYNIQVQAFQLARAASGAEETAALSLTINTDAQALPQVIYANSLHIGLLDLDLQSQKVLGYTASEIEHLALIQAENRLLWVNENVELISYVPGFAQTKLARMRAEVMALTVDWVQRIVYWAELSTDEQTVAIYKLDLCHYEGYVSMGTKIGATHPGRLIKDLLVLPFSQSLLWLEYAAEEPQNATLNGLHLKDYSVLHFKHHQATYSHMFEGSLKDNMQTVNLLGSQGKLCTYELQRQLCTQLKLTLPANATQNIIDLARDNGYIYVLTPERIAAYNRRKKSLDYNVQHQQAKCIKAYNSQPYPSRACLLPAAGQQMSTQLRKVDEQYVTLELPKLTDDKHCQLPVPGTKYALRVFQVHKNLTESFVQNVTSFERLVNITQLQHFTNYSISIAASSYYQKKLQLPPPLLSNISICTTPGTPSEPRNFTAYALSATEIQVSWAPPSELNCDRVWYQLHWQLLNSSLGMHQTLNGTYFTLLDLKPSQSYLIWLKVFSMEHKFNSTAPLYITTFDEPRELLLEQKTAYNLTLSWLPPTNLKSIMLVYYVSGEEEFANRLPLDVDNGTLIQLLHLTPKTRYELYFALTYNTTSPVPHVSQWPTPLNARFSFETLGDCPSRPGKPQIEYIVGEIFKLSWSPALPHGAPIVEYSMEALQPHLPKRLRRQVNESFVPLIQPLWAEEPTPIEDQWLVYCNTTELSCIVKEVYSQRLVLFRVRARNQPYGWGPYSELSDRIMEPMVTPERRNSLIIAIVSPAAIVSFCVLVLVAVKLVKQRRLRKEKLLAQSRPSIWSNMSSVQQQLLLQQRMRAASIASHSTLYYGGPLSDADIALLPQVSWKQLAITKFLGSGAFGEVYEGLIQYADEPEPEKVAIKSLRKGYSEFSELLKEAQLMSNFKHENIVGLIGISYDTETISIIMEYMEGGDLLTYLRDSRPNSNKPMQSLKLIELLTMCIDVATGCSYLEDMHFVHRDLACRNCLVSSRDPAKRMVKIGDFGLARDIYKSDYYRKEGEGLLPVRWMPPESLVDGVFTTQSDVWSFAVLCWEILTLGQQPYAGRNNIEVLNFVKDGGRLEQPEDCPEKLYDFLHECWQVDPDERPSFRRCLNMLLAIKTEVRRFSSGYNIDNVDYALYANSQSVVLSSFLGKPLDRVDEEPELDYRSSIENPSKYEDIVLKRQSGEVSTKPSTFMTLKRSSMSNKAASASSELQLPSPEPKEVHFESLSKSELELGSMTDLAVLIAGMQSKQNGEEPGVYENEGFSRL